MLAPEACPFYALTRQRRASVPACRNRGKESERTSSARWDWGTLPATKACKRRGPSTSRLPRRVPRREREQGAATGVPARRRPAGGTEHRELRRIDDHRVIREREVGDEDRHREPDAAQQSRAHHVTPAHVRRQRADPDFTATSAHQRSRRAACRSATRARCRGCWRDSTRRRTARSIGHAGIRERKQRQDQIRDRLVQAPRSSRCEGDSAVGLRGENGIANASMTPAIDA